MNLPASERDTRAHSELRRLFRAFLLTGAAAPLVQHVALHPACATRCSHDYPVAHRILDFEFGERAFRVSRCWECDERLSILPLDIPARPELGVPYELSGSALESWINQERVNPAKAEQDWGDYLQQGAPL